MEFLEFFAGVANTTKYMRYSDYRAAKFDLLYGPDVKAKGSSRGTKKSNSKKSNYMDLLSNAGFAYLILI